MPVKKSRSSLIKKVKTITGNRYGRGSAQLITKGIPQLYKDVMNLKWLLNVEKKQYNNPTSSSIAVGSVSQNASGHVCIDITPNPAIGSTGSTRNGDSIKLLSAYHKFQFFQQTNNSSPMKLIVEYFILKGRPITSAATVISDLFTPNRYIKAGIVNGDVYDSNSDRQQESYANFKLLARKKITLAPDSNTNQLMIKEMIIKLRLKNHHLRFDPTSSALTAGQIYMVIRADVGNSAAVASTLTNSIIQGVSSGAGFNFDHTWYYTDN